MEISDLPAGFFMALAPNPKAMQKFATLPEEKKQRIIDSTLSVSSKDEMKTIVNNIILK